MKPRFLSPMSHDYARALPLIPPNCWLQNLVSMMLHSGNICWCCRARTKQMTLYKLLYCCPKSRRLSTSIAQQLLASIPLLFNIDDFSTLWGETKWERKGIHGGSFMGRTNMGIEHLLSPIFFIFFWKIKSPFSSSCQNGCVCRWQK